jgi:hypothetical protein
MAPAEDELRPDGYPANWPQPEPPLESAVGQRAEDVAGVYEAGGFLVDLFDLDTDWKASLDLRGDRIRIWHRDGRVVSARQC